MNYTLMDSIIIVLLCITVSFSPFTANADNKNNTDVYEKLFEVTGGKAQFEQMVDLYINQMQIGFSQGVQRAIEKSENNSPEEREEIIKLLDKSIQNFMKEMKTELPKVMSYEKLLKEVYIPIYAKHFTTDEIEEVISFYEGPTGKKFIQENPIIIQEAMIIINQKYTPKLSELGQNIGAKEGTKIENELANLLKK